MTEYDLFIGNRSTGISVIPDKEYSGMWRVRDRDGRLSDIVNISRAKDAALSWALTGRGGGIGRQIIEWRCTETPLKIPTAA